MSELSVVGKSLPRVDGVEKVTGSAAFVSDLTLPRMLQVKVLRSPHPHARVLSVDTSRALAVPGVRAIIIGEDTPKVKWGPIIADEYILAVDKVRYVGEEVAAVAAESLEAAEEAAGLIRVEYEELPAVFDPLEAMGPEAPRLHDKGNIAFHIVYSRGDIEEGFRKSDQVFEGRYETHMNHQGYMEPRACIASADPSGRITLWVGTQNIFHLRRWLAGALQMSESQIRVIQPHVGGGFGGKTTSSEAPICALLALRTGRPVKLVNTWADDFQAGRPRVPAIIQNRVGVKKDGTFVARQTKVITNVGAYADHAPGVTETMAIRPDCLYRFSYLEGECSAVYTNRTPTGACRGFGNPQGAFAMETMVDEIASALKMDPLTLRLKNAVGPGHINLHGWRITSCGLKQCLEEAARLSGWKEKRAKKAPGRGLGLACAIHVCGNRIAFNYDGSSAFIKIEEDGKVTLITGESDTGQGAWSVLAQIAAEELGVPFADVRVAQADTDVAPYCFGAYASRVTFIGGNAVRAAAKDAKAQLIEAAARALEANPKDLTTGEGKVFVKGAPSRALTFREASRAAIYRNNGAPILGRGSYDPPTEQQNKYTLMGNFSPAYTFCAQIAEVEVDVETGETRLISIVSADDVGRPINPMAVEGQIEGSVAQGWGLATMEELVWEGGNLINLNFMDYKMPAAPEVPAIVSVIVDSEDPEGAFGAKSSSETAIVPVPAAIANAIHDAVGVRIHALPLTPERILRAIQGKF